MHRLNHRLREQVRSHALRAEARSPRHPGLGRAASLECGAFSLYAIPRLILAKGRGSELVRERADMNAENASA
ncbi:hypothetical protein BW686_25195 [Pseudomonas syringae]|uniref:Uncharacterized protein n=1 Tax=Pseudomonas syringae TaxID=317 RepID=A0A244EJN1_PSESX|nr:hypothetical protein BW686_25195 [Pseudomonas syringae]